MNEGKSVMNRVLTDETVLLQTTWCVVREQGKEFLIYNRQTDELHLLPPTGYFAFRLCDGVNTVADIERQLASDLGDRSSHLRNVLHDFLNKLIARGIVEVEDGETDGTREFSSEPPISHGLVSHQLV